MAKRRMYSFTRSAEAITITDGKQLFIVDNRDFRNFQQCVNNAGVNLTLSEYKDPNERPEEDPKGDSDSDSGEPKTE
jgi:hypothetical protein